MARQGDATVAFLVRDGKAVRVGVQTGYNDGKHVEVHRIESVSPGTGAASWAEPTGTEAFVLKAAGVTDGQPVAAGTRVRLADGGSTVVGYDGELWLERYRDGDALQWTRAGQGCSARLPGQSAGTTPVRIGPLRCIAEVATP